MDALELSIHIENTAAYIGYKPTVVTLTPETRTPTPSGGYKTSDLPPRLPQTFRVIELGANVTPPILTLTDGKQRSPEFLLLALPTADVAVDDHWTASDGREWSVGDIVRDNLYEIRALVVERGR